MKKEEAHRFQARLVGGNLIELPVEQLRRIANTSGVDSIEQETKHFSYSTTLHGPLRLYKGKGYGKIFWSLVMCFALVFLSVQINILIAYFMSHPTATSVTFVPAEALTLPAVTVCNYNPITKSYVQYLNESSSGAGYFTYDLLRYMIMAYSEVEDLYLHANYETIEKGRRAYNYFQSIFTEYPFNIENFFARAGFACHEMLKVCSVGGTNLDCCAISRQVLTDLGSCFVFSVDDMKLNQTQPGIFNGLQLILDAGVNDAVAVNYTEEGNTIPIFSNNLEDGFRLYVRNEDELAYSYTEGLSVSPAYRAYIALNLETFHFLTPDKWGNCTHSWPTKSPRRAFRLPYTSQNCASLCQQVYYEQRINCTPLLYSVGDGQHITFSAHLNTCTPSELHAFMLKVADRTNNINGPECADNICPTSCVTHEYKASITYGYGFSESAMDWLTNINDTWTAERIKENFAVVNIFYREMSYMLNEQIQSTSLVDVLSNIGGNMGLFFGASVITVIELVIFFSKLGWIAFSSRRREYMFHKRQKERDREQPVMELSQVERLISWFKKIASGRSFVEHGIKREVLQMMGATKLHGCYRLYAGKTYARLFWLLVAISIGIFFFIVLVELTGQFKASGISTQVEIVYDYADGPSITICSHNPVRRNYVEELKRTTSFSDDLSVYLLYIFLRPESLIKMNLTTDLFAGEKLLRDYMLNYSNFTIASFVSEASFKCEEAFVQCAFEGIMFDCCNERYSTEVFTDLGQCLQFDWKQLSADFSLGYHFGSVHGFQVMLDHQSHNTFHLTNYSDTVIRQAFLDNFEPGFRIYVHDTNAIPHTNSEVLVVSPNNKLSTGLKPVKYQFLERSRGGTCSNTWPPNLQLNLTYSASACKMACKAKYFISNCGCIPLHYDTFKEGKLCSPKEVVECVKNFPDIASVVSNFNDLPLCQNCASECELFIYYTQNSIIHNILTSLGEYMRNMKKQYRLSYVRDNLATVHIFFAAKKYKMYSQSTLSDLSDYFSKIGSNMGLFYGASVISLFELALVLIKIVWTSTFPSRALYLKGKSEKEIERKLRIEEIINEYSAPCRVIRSASETFDANDCMMSSEKISIETGVVPWLKRKLSPSFSASFPPPQRKIGQVLSLTLTPEQASAILEAETFVDSIYVPLRKDKVNIHDFNI
ncbi:unnamed protein product [Thelazia callipaeda]|uniref:Acid-sensing ion channel 1-like n=1 Tax=Thelazia callipaeda TaxID=103827 RepID=A0A158RCH7_THECL|nr:unnamed protein product [Thelazia callipaeda]